MDNNKKTRIVNRYPVETETREFVSANIIEVEVGHIDFLRDVAFVKVTYKPFAKTQNTINNITKLKDFQ